MKIRNVLWQKFKLFPSVLFNKTIYLFPHLLLYPLGPFIHEQHLKTYQRPVVHSELLLKPKKRKNIVDLFLFVKFATGQGHCLYQRIVLNWMHSNLLDEINSALYLGWIKREHPTVHHGDVGPACTHCDSVVVCSSKWTCV